jgi:UDP-glucose 4-epimerase
MRTLVTGGAGFIGSNLVDKLVEQNHDVAVVDNLLTGRRKNLNPSVAFYETDIRDAASMGKVFDMHKPEVVFHTAAGYLVQSLENPQRDAEINIIGTINLINLGIKYGTKKFVYSNSGGASYGEPQTIPITEDHPVHPLTPYGASKYTAEMYFYMFHRNHGLDYTSLRYGNVYGPRQNPKLEGGVVAVFLDAFMSGRSPVMKSDGTPTRDYVYVGDVVDANIAAMAPGHCDGYHVATGIETNVLGLIDIMRDVLKTNLPVTRGTPRIGDPQRAVFDISKIRREIGWQPRVSLREGIARTAEWMRGELGESAT